MKIYINWVKINRVLRIIEFCVLVFGVIFTVIQVKDIINNQDNRQSDLMFRYDDKLNSDINTKLFLTIEKEKPILIKNGGKFNEEDLDYFLGIFNQIYESQQKGLINNDLIYSNFSYFLEKTYNNKEIKNYLKEIRIEDEDYFAGFDELAESQIKLY
jgi:hypothetical protein